MEFLPFAVGLSSKFLSSNISQRLSGFFSQIHTPCCLKYFFNKRFFGGGTPFFYTRKETGQTPFFFFSPAVGYLLEKYSPSEHSSAVFNLVYYFFSLRIFQRRYGKKFTTYDQQ